MKSMIMSGVYHIHVACKMGEEDLMHEESLSFNVDGLGKNLRALKLWRSLI